MPQCPKCQGDMFDERKSKYWNNGKTKEGKQKPIFKYKDKANCDGVIWPPKQPATPQGNGPTTPRVAEPARPLAPLYANCVELAATILKKHVPNAAPSDVLSAAACLFIAASRDGTPLMPPKAAKPVPTPKPPEPEDYPDEAPEYSSHDNLPF